jgi:serine protease
MQGLQKLVILAWALAWNATGAWAQFVLPEPDSGQRPYSITAERSGERAGGAVSIELATQLRSIHVPGARFVKLHFSAFNLPEGVIVEVSNPAGSEVYRYSASHRDPFTFDRKRGDTGKGSFWAMSISGETAIVRMLGDLTKFDPAIHSVVVDSHIANTPGKTKDPVDPGSTTQTECGQNERYDAICWADSHPGEYDRSVPVAMIVTSAGKECTAWRVGSGNRMFTARHCIASQAELDGAEIWFNFETTECGGPSTGTEVKVTGGSLLKQDYHLDYALFTVDDFASISSFGSLGLDVRNGVIGEEIFIPQHGLGRPKQLAIESDMNDNGLCQVDANDIDGFEPESDIGYLCDTTTSSSGSPVISSSTGKVIALHHWGGCFNSGTKVTMIWPQVAEFFGGSVPKGNEKGGWAPGNELPVAQFSYSCDELDCTLNGGESYDEDGEIINFTWDFGDGVSASGAIVEHTFSGPGNYPVTLTVKDDEDATYSQLKTVTPSLPNENPVAKFSTSCIDNACSFDAGGSKDEDGTVVAWDWSLGDGESATGQSIEQVYSESGSYTISLTVTDDDDATGDSNYTVTVNLPNEKPIAKFSSSCTENACSFDAADSLDEDGTIVDWSWSLGDGASKSGIRFEHAYAAAGSYSITLTIEDDRGARDSVTNTVAVTMENQPQNKVKIEVIQGGLWYTDTLLMLESIPHETTEVSGIKHEHGTFSMARNEPGTATSEFFICVNDQPSLDHGGLRNPDEQGFSAFGKVIKGMDIVILIHQSPNEIQMLTPPI